MAFRAVERVCDSAASAAVVTKKLTHYFAAMHEELTDGFDLRDALYENKEGEDMDTVVRVKAEAYGEPAYVAKRGNSKPTAEEVLIEQPFALHELVQTVKYNRRELRQANRMGWNLRSRGLMIAGQNLDLTVRNHMTGGYSPLGLPGLNSDINKIVFDQASGAISGKDDFYMEQLLLEAKTNLAKQIGSDFGIGYVLMGSEWNTRLSRGYGNIQGMTFIDWLSKRWGVPLSNFKHDTRLDGKGLGGSYSGKDPILLVPTSPRICEALSPVRKAFDVYESDGDLAIDVYAQHGGIAVYEKIGGIADG